MSYIAKHLHEETGLLVDAEGCSWDDAQSFLAVEIFGFCGCGDPAAALRLVRDAMRLIERTRADDTLPWDKLWPQVQAAERELFGANEGVKYVVWYLLADKDLTEHGGSVPGWLTEKGRDVLADLESLNLGAL